MGYVPGVEEYVAAGGTLQTARVLDAEGLKSMMEKPDIQVVDLRGASEYKSGHIQGADNVFVGTLPQNLDKVHRSGNVVVLCQGGDRASIGYSLLASEGFDNLWNYIPSMNDWVNRGNPVVS
jgi:hydroxyacylglutathione hydrolase